MSSKESFSGSLVSDPTQRTILAAYQRAFNNKLKTRMAAEKIVLHDPAALVTTKNFLTHRFLKKSIIETVIWRIRHDAPNDYAARIKYISDHYDEALALRAELKPQQTYVSVCGALAGLASYAGHDAFTKEYRSALLAAVYLCLADSDDSELTYNNVERYVRLNNGELLEFLDEHADDAASIRDIMIRHRTLRAAEIEAALAGNTTNLLNGAL